MASERIRASGGVVSAVGAALAIARVTLAHLVRDPAILLVTGGAALLVVLAPAYMVFQFGELRKVMVDAGLSTALLAGVLVALLGPARALAEEIEGGTALGLLSKPLGRLSLVAGKYLGVLAAAAAAVAPLGLLTLYVVRIAEAMDDDVAGRLVAPVLLVAAGTALAVTLAAALARRARLAAGWLALVGCLAAGLLVVRPLGAWRWEVLPAAVLVFLEVGVVAAAATAAAARFGALGTMVAGLLVMVAGHARAVYGWARLGEAGAAIGGVVPGLEALSAVEAAAAGVRVGPEYLGLAALYAALYVAALLLLGAALLQGREAA